MKIKANINHSISQTTLEPTVHIEVDIEMDNCLSREQFEKLKHLRYSSTPSALRQVADMLQPRKTKERPINTKLYKELTYGIGICVSCKQNIRNFKSPVGSFALEAWITLRDQGIDPRTGHKEDCPFSNI